MLLQKKSSDTEGWGQLLKMKKNIIQTWGRLVFGELISHRAKIDVPYVQCYGFKNQGKQITQQNVSLIHIDAH